MSAETGEAEGGQCENRAPTDTETKEDIFSDATTLGPSSAATTAEGQGPRGFETETGPSMLHVPNHLQVTTSHGVASVVPFLSALLSYEPAQKTTCQGFTTLLSFSIRSLHVA